MKVLVAMDSFKGSLSSAEANRAVQEGILQASPKTEVTCYPIADGGEGTVEALLQNQEYERINIKVTGPLGGMVDAYYGILPVKNLAVMEMAVAAGLTLLGPEDRNPLYTTTYGVGEMIRDAITRGIRDFVIGIGGSATNDAGIGMLQALGYEFTDENGVEVGFGAEGLSKVKKISTINALPELSDCRFQIACDVSNPLCGEQGCSLIFGPQKGADQETAQKMDAWMRRFAETVRISFPQADEKGFGAGAAGGIGYAFRTFLHAKLEPGISIVFKWNGMEEELKKADLVITGEGKLDGQTLMGKTPVGVAKLAKQYGKPVIALAGVIGRGADALHDHGIDAYFPILDQPRSREEAMTIEVAYENLKHTAEQVMRLVGTAI